MSEKSSTTMGEKVKKIYKPIAVFLCVLVIILSIAGAAITVFSEVPQTNQETLKTAQDLFICVIIFSIIALILGLFVRFQKGGDKSKYEINEKSDKSAKGLDNVAFDGEKGTKEKWMDNYVPYGQFPKGAPIEEEVVVENEKDNKTEEEEKWKENYVPYEEEQEKKPDNNE